MPKFYSDVVLNDGALQAKTNGQTDLGTSSVKLKNAFFAGEVSATQGFIGDLTGNADTATVLATARNINGVSFNGSANINIPTLGEADQEITGNRVVDLADNSLAFKNGVQNIMVLQDGLVTISEPVLFTNSGGYTVGEIRLKEAPAATGDEYVGFKANGALAASTVWELPAADGSNGQVLSTNGSAVLSWVTAGASTTMNHFINFGVNLQYALARWIPIGSYYISEQNTAGNPEFTTYVAPYDGKIIKVEFRSEETLANTILAWYKATDGTLAPATLIDTKTVDIDTANTNFTYTFDSDAEFNKGDALGLKITPTTDPVGAGVTGTIVFEFDLSS
jgi:hypothetical protein